MSSYNTEQKKMLLDYMSSHSDTPITIEELIDKLSAANQGKVIPGRSTVYRLMNKLVESGDVKRFVKGHSRKFCYQIVESSHCHDHIHMKCTTCGKLYHMDDSDTEKLLIDVLKHSHFKVDREETTLYGTCDGCALITK